jgi:hypothetical protein
MPRAALIVWLAAARLAAGQDTSSRAAEVALANALNSGNPDAALQLFDPKMPGYGRLEDNLEKLMHDSGLALDIHTETGVWNLDITARDASAGVTRREAKVRIRVADGVIVAFEPVEFLAPSRGAGAWQTVFTFATTLQDAEAPPAMSQFDDSKPDYAPLKQALLALWTRYEITVSLDLLSNEGDDAHRTLVIDWTLNLHNPNDDVDSTQREQTITAKVNLENGKWKIVSLTPASLFTVK